MSAMLKLNTAGRCRMSDPSVAGGLDVRVECAARAVTAQQRKPCRQPGLLQASHAEARTGSVSSPRTGGCHAPELHAVSAGRQRILPQNMAWTLAWTLTYVADVKQPAHPQGMCTMPAVLCCARTVLCCWQHAM